MSGAMDGRIGGAIVGFDVHVTVDGHRIRGRMGGDYQGKDVDLEFGDHGLSGRWGGAVNGKDIECTIDGNTLTGTFGGMMGRRLTLTQDGNHITGECEANFGFSGFEIDFEFGADGHVVGRMQGFIGGKDLDCTAHGIPPLVAAALVAAVNWELQLQRSRH
jgi:hypothetical protein